MKKTIKIFLLCVSASMLGSISGFILANYSFKAQNKLCKSETLNECLMSGEVVKECIIKAIEKCS